MATVDRLPRHVVAIPPGLRKALTSHGQADVRCADSWGALGYTAAGLVMREFCYECFRPQRLCLCAHIPTVPNRTEVTVLQHVRERFHPFGSVRMLMRALARGRLEVAFRGEGKDVHCPLVLPVGTGLLYPRPDAKVLGELDEIDRPSNLVLLDGTWSQAHRLYRDNPWLKELPHYRIDPEQKSRYLVRKEPKEYCLSTLEAAVCALRLLEPGLEGLDELLEVFVRMNLEQVEAKSRVRSEPRKKRVRRNRFRAVPQEMLGRDDNLVVVYGETSEIATRLDPRIPELFQWCALRLSTGEVFSCFVQPQRGEPSVSHLQRLGLGVSDVNVPRLSHGSLQTSFKDFLRPQDVLLAWNSGTFDLLPAEVAPAGHERVLLKGCYCNARGGPCGMLEDVVAREELSPWPVEVPGRAGERLGNAAAVATFLRRLARQRLPVRESPSATTASE